MRKGVLYKFLVSNQLARFGMTTSVCICLFANFNHLQPITTHNYDCNMAASFYDLGLNPGQPIFYLLLPIYGLMGLKLQVVGEPTKTHGPVIKGTHGKAESFLCVCQINYVTKVKTGRQTERYNLNLNGRARWFTSSCRSFCE